MKCRDATAMIDLGTVPKNLWGRFQFMIHLALCTACRRYLKASRALASAARSLVQKSIEIVDMKELNQNLVRRFSKQE